MSLSGLRSKSSVPSPLTRPSFTDISIKRSLSVADTPYTTPPLSPFVRKIEVVVLFDPENLSISSTIDKLPLVPDTSNVLVVDRDAAKNGSMSSREFDKYTDVNVKARPLARFGGSLSWPDSVCQVPWSASSSMAPLDARSSFTAREPIVAQSVTTVYTDASTTFPLSSFAADTCQPSEWGTGSFRRDLPSLSRCKVGMRSELLACKQQPQVSSGASTQFYPLFSVERMDYSSNLSGVTPLEQELSDNSSRSRAMEQMEKEKEARKECFVYGAKLVDDDLWAKMCSEGAKLSRYTIVQELIGQMDGSLTKQGETFLIIRYNFKARSAQTQESHSEILSPGSGQQHQDIHDSELSSSTLCFFSDSNLSETSHSPWLSASPRSSGFNSPVLNLSLRKCLRGSNNDVFLKASVEAQHMQSTNTRLDSHTDSLPAAMIPVTNMVVEAPHSANVSTLASGITAGLRTLNHNTGGPLRIMKVEDFDQSLFLHTIAPINPCDRTYTKSPSTSTGCTCHQHPFSI